MEVKVIQPTSPSSGPAGRGRPALLRVAAYCRVSTESDEQKSSYEAQRRHYTSVIEANPAWTLAGIYADEGISGTQARCRPEFLRMVRACEAGGIDLVITKSISRFARNNMDCLDYIRQLKALDIPVIFEKESINTMDSSGEVLITILASLAQQESASISQNVKMGIRYVMQEGRGRLNYRQFLGYTAGSTRGSLVIVPEEAEVVRLIYRRYLEGYSPAHIARQLEGARVPTPTGRSCWHASTIASILRNEKYRGDLLLQKYYTQDYLTHREVRNEGQLPQYLVEDHHEPIVPKAVFAQVQGEIARRSSLRGKPSLLRFGSERALRGRVVCGACGRTLKACVASDGTLLWRCCRRATSSARREPEPRAQGCGMCAAKDEDVRAAVLEAFDRLPCLRDAIALARDGLRRRMGQLVEPAGLAEGRANCTTAPTLHAELANHEMHLRMLAELVEEMDARERRPGPCDRAPEPEAGDSPASFSCGDYEDFFCRSRWKVPEGLLGEGGRLLRFDDELVVRHLRSVVCREREFEVVLKAGVSLCVPRI